MFMARSKSFDRDEVLERAIPVFAEHGYEGTSAQMLTDAMGIGRQSIYDTFVDKWQLYLAALRHYTRQSISEQLAALKSKPKAIDGLRAHLEAFVTTAAKSRACLGLSAVSEFGCDRMDVVEIARDAGRALHAELERRVSRAQEDGDLSADVTPAEAADFLMTQLSALKLAARAGAGRDALQRMAVLGLRALR